MIAIDIKRDKRVGRLYLPGDTLPTKEKIAAAASGMLDDEDLDRERLLREALTQELVHATVHPGVDPEDVLQIYIDSRHGRLFACTVVSAWRLDEMLKEVGAVVEGFCLQVAPEGLEIAAALDIWAARCFPDLPSPVFDVDAWSSEPDFELGIVEAGDLNVSLSESDLPDEVYVPDVKQLGLEDEAA